MGNEKLEMSPISHYLMGNGAITIETIKFLIKIEVLIKSIKSLNGA